MKVRLTIATVASIVILGVSALVSAGGPTLPKSVQLYASPSNELLGTLQARIGARNVQLHHLRGKDLHGKDPSNGSGDKEGNLTPALSSNPTTPAANVQPIQLITGIKGLAWPASGEAAIGAEGLDFIDSNQPANHPVPIASLTKIMTAYVILKDHPLAPGGNGPAVRIDGADVETTYNDELNDETIVPIVHGEVLTERQTLEGLMVHSACNLAYVLARWDSGSVSAFVAKMNRTAQVLGLDFTRYVGPAGFSPGSVSTATDLTKLAMDAMSIPAFARIVDHPSINLPDAGILYNYVSAIGQAGVIGVKSGFTYQSDGCVVLAAIRSVEGAAVTLVAAVTGQGGMDPLGSAQNAALALIDSMTSQLHIDNADLTGDVVGSIRPLWLAAHASRTQPHASRTRYSIVVSGDIDLLEWPGAEPKAAIQFDRQSYTCNALRPGIQVGTMTVSLGALTSVVPLVIPHVPLCKSA